MTYKGKGRFYSVSDYQQMMPSGIEPPQGFTALIDKNKHVIFRCNHTKNDIQCNFGIENRTLSKAKSDAERLNYLTHKHECTSLEPFVSRKPVERSPIPSAGSSKNYQDYAKTVNF